MRSQRFLVLTAIASLMLNACSSNVSVKPTVKLKRTVPAMCSVLCPEMPATNESKIETIRELRAWGNDCRSRQAECVGWIRETSE